MLLNILSVFSLKSLTAEYSIGFLNLKSASILFSSAVRAEFLIRKGITTSRVVFALFLFSCLL